MKPSVRMIGAFLILDGLLQLGGLLFLDLSTLAGPAALISRYVLLTLGGIGFVLLLRWGVVLYFGSLTINWIAYFTIYVEAPSVGPLLLTFFLPVIVAVISYSAWGDLKWGFPKREGPL